MVSLQCQTRRSFGFRQTVVKRRMEAFKGGDAIFSGGQLAIHQISGGTAALDHGFGIEHAFPYAAVLAPFQKELGTGPGLAHQIQLQRIDPAGTEAVCKCHRSGLTGNHRHSLGIFRFIDIQAIFGDLLIDQVIAFFDIARKDGPILSGGEGADEGIFAAAYTVSIELPSGNAAAVRHILDDLELTKLCVLGYHGNGLAGLDGHDMRPLVKDPIRVGGTFIHFLHKEGSFRDLYLDLSIRVRGEGRTGQQLRKGSIGEDIVLPALFIRARVGILLDDKVCLGNVGDGDRSGLLRYHVHIMIAHIQIVASMVVAAVLLHQVPSGCKIRKGIGRIVFILLGGAAADVVETSIVQHLPQIDLPAQFHTFSVGGGFSDCQITGPLGVLCVDGISGAVLGQGHIPLGSAAGSIPIREYAFIHIEGGQGKHPGTGITVYGRTDGIFNAGIQILRDKIGTVQGISICIILVHLNVPVRIFRLRQLDMIPCRGRGRFRPGAGHVLHGADLRAAAVAHMDDIMVDTAVGAAGVIHGISTCIDGNMGQTAAGIGEHDNVTGDQVGIGGGGIGIPGNTAAGLGSQIFQARFPCPHACGGIGTTVHGGSLDGIRYPGGVDTFNIGKIVVPVIAYEGSTHKALFLKLCDIGRTAGHGTWVCHGLVTVAEGGIIIVADIGKHLGGVGLDVGRSILRYIQIAVILQVIHIVSGIGQGPQNVIIVHFIGDQAHISQQHDPIGVSFQQIVRKIIVHGQAVGIRPVGIIGIFLYNGIRSDRDTLRYFLSFGFLRGLGILHGFGFFLGLRFLCRFRGPGFFGHFLRVLRWRSRLRRFGGIGGLRGFLRHSFRRFLRCRIFCRYCFSGSACLGFLLNDRLRWDGLHRFRCGSGAVRRCCKCGEGQAHYKKQHQKYRHKTPIYRFQSASSFRFVIFRMVIAGQQHTKQGFARWGYHCLLTEMAVGSNKVLDLEQAPVGLLCIRKQIPAGTAVQETALYEKFAEGPFSNVQFLCGGPDIGTVLRVEEGIKESCLGLHFLHLPGQARVSLMLCQKLPRELQQHLGIGCRLFQQGACHISACLTDAGENFLKDPFFKPLRAGQTAMDNEPVNITFRDIRKALDTTCRKGVTFRYTLTMVNQCLAGILVAQSKGNIGTAKKQPAIITDDTHAAELLITEGLHFHHVFHNRLLLYSFVTSRMASPGRVDMIR